VTLSRYVMTEPCFTVNTKHTPDLISPGRVYLASFLVQSQCISTTSAVINLYTHVSLNVKRSVLSLSVLMTYIYSERVLFPLLGHASSFAQLISPTGSDTGPVCIRYTMHYSIK